MGREKSNPEILVLIPISLLENKFPLVFMWVASYTVKENIW